MDSINLYSKEDEMEVPPLQHFHNSSNDSSPHSNEGSDCVTKLPTDSSVSVISISSDTSSQSAEPHVSPFICKKTSVRDRQQRRKQIRSIIQGCHFCRRNHFVKSCPLRICPLCGKNGHSLEKCKNRCDLFKICNRCQLHGHTARRCPELWRQYHSTTSPGPPLIPSKTPKPVDSCAICAGKHHYSKCAKSNRGSVYIFKPKITKYDKNDVYVGQPAGDCQDELVNPFHLIHDMINSGEDLMDGRGCNEVIREGNNSRGRFRRNGGELCKNNEMLKFANGVPYNKSRFMNNRGSAGKKSTFWPKSQRKSENSTFNDSSINSQSLNQTVDVAKSVKFGQRSVGVRKKRSKSINNKCGDGNIENNSYFLLKRNVTGLGGSRNNYSFASEQSSCPKRVKSFRPDSSSTSVADFSHKFGRRFKRRGFDLSFGSGDGKSDL